MNRKNNVDIGHYVYWEYWSFRDKAQWNTVTCNLYTQLWNILMCRRNCKWKTFWDHMRSYHYNDVTMSAMASQITSLAIVYPTANSGANQRKHQSSASLAFVKGIHQWPVNSPSQRPVARKMFPFKDVITIWWKCTSILIYTEAEHYL